MILANRPEGENHNEREKSSFLPHLPKALVRAFPKRLQP